MKTLLLLCVIVVAAIIEATSANSIEDPYGSKHHGKPPAHKKHQSSKHHGGSKHHGKHGGKHGRPARQAAAPAPVSESLSRGDVGDRLLRTFLVFNNQPLNVDDAQSQGFTQFTDGCTQFGYGYAKGSDGSGPSKGDSSMLYFTEGGQLAGFGSRMWGEAPDALVDQGYWMTTDSDDQAYDLIIQTRDPSMICSGDTDLHAVGDRLLINGGQEIPLTMDDAQSAGWVEGNCIGKMGIHHAYDLNYPFSQSWNVSSLVPVLPMYHPQTLHVTAILLASSDPQRIEPFGVWEGPFINMLMCKNWCANTGCTFPGVSLWTTMHWLFDDPSLNQCDGAKCIL